MRQLVYLLLLANLVYLGWNLYQRPVGSELVRELPPLPTTARRLVTLQELQQQQEEQRSAVQQEQEERQDSEVQEEQVEQQDMDNVAAVEALTQAEPPGAGVSILCQALGPFLATEQLEEVAGRLGDLGLQSSRRSAETRLENGWWVYLPAMPRARALKVAQQLDDNNDREYYIGKDNFISLGTFRVLPRAERRVKGVRKLGLEPLLEARYKTQTAHWLDLRVTDDQGEQLAWISEDYPRLQLEQQSCR